MRQVIELIIHDPFDITPKHPNHDIIFRHKVVQYWISYGSVRYFEIWSNKPSNQNVHKPFTFDEGLI